MEQQLGRYYALLRIFRTTLTPAKKKFVNEIDIGPKKKVCLPIINVTYHIPYIPYSNNTK